MCLLLTDVNGVFDRPPSEEGAKIIKFFDGRNSVAIGEKSASGRGGMQAKINAAISAVRPGSKTYACIVASGTDLNSIRSVLYPKFQHNANSGAKGTLFVTPGSQLEKQCLEEAKSEQVRHFSTCLPSLLIRIFIKNAYLTQLLLLFIADVSYV